MHIFLSLWNLPIFCRYKIEHKMHLSSLTPKLKKFIDGVEPLKRYFAMEKTKTEGRKMGCRNIYLMAILRSIWFYIAYKHCLDKKLNINWKFLKVHFKPNDAFQYHLSTDSSKCNIWIKSSNLHFWQITLEIQAAKLFLNF